MKSNLLIYGNHNIGKTYQILQALKDYKYLSIDV
jgi:hypothetical protein